LAHSSLILIGRWLQHYVFILNHLGPATAFWQISPLQCASTICVEKSSTAMHLVQKERLAKIDVLVKTLQQ
jgi:hypothetical protein